MGADVSYYRQQPSFCLTQTQLRSRWLPSDLLALEGTPEQMVLEPVFVCEKETPGLSIKKRIDNQLTTSTEQYIRHCLRTGDYSRYLNYWASQELTFGRPDYPIFYSETSILSLEITSTETFFNLPPGTDLGSYFEICFFSTPHFLFDYTGSPVNNGPIGGIWGYETCESSMTNEPWAIEKFLRIRPQILSFALRMSSSPRECPSSADFTLKMSFSDGTEASGTYSCIFNYN